jgi:hypothetical protein
MGNGWANKYRNIDVDESEDTVRAAPLTLGGMHVLNATASVRYLKLYDALTADVTVGTTTPDWTFEIPTNGDTNGAGFIIDFGDRGVDFDTGLCIAATTDISSNGAPGANEVLVNAWYD